MSLIAEPYRCDVCGVLKRETNHWWLGKGTDAVIAIMPWDGAEAMAAWTDHLCGVECVQRWTANMLGKIIANSRSANAK